MLPVEKAMEIILRQVTVMPVTTASNLQGGNSDTQFRSSFIVTVPEQCQLLGVQLTRLKTGLSFSLSIFLFCYPFPTQMLLAASLQRISMPSSLSHPFLPQ